MRQDRVDQAYVTELLKILVRRFSVDELRMLCFELGVDDEILPDYAKSAFARELLRYLEQRRELETLVEYLQRERSDIILPETRRAVTRHESLKTQTEVATQPQNAWRRVFENPITACFSLSEKLVLLGLRITEDARAPYGGLVALEVASGTERWRRAFKNAQVAGLTSLNEDGSVGVALTSGDTRLDEGALVGIGSSGQIHWRHPLNTRSVSAPASEGASLCAVVDGRMLLVLDATTGIKRWSRTFDTELSTAPPAVDRDTLYLPCHAPMLIAVSLEGQVRWRFSVPGALSGVWLDRQPWVMPDIVITTARQGAVFAIDRPHGGLIWESEVGPRDANLTRPVGDEQRLYIGARDGLHALQIDDGRPIWMFSTPSPVVAPPSVRDGMVCVVTEAGRYYGLSASKGRILWYGALTHGGGLAPMLMDGDVYGPYALFADREGALSTLRYPVRAEQHEAAGRWYRAARTWDAEGNPTRAARAWETYARSLADNERAEADRIEAWRAAKSRYQEIGADEKAAVCQQECARHESLPVVRLDVEHPPMAKDVWSQLRLLITNAGFGVARELWVETTGGPFEGDTATPQTLSALPPGTSRIRALDAKALEHGRRVPLHLRVSYLDESGTRHSHDQTLTIPVAEREEAGRAGLITESDSTYVDMEIRVDPGPMGSYDVEVTLGDGRVFSGGQLSADILDWQPSGDRTRDGRELFSALLGHSAMQRAWHTARAGASPCRVRLRISHNAQHLHAIPWELMDDGTCILAADEHTPFSRYVPVSKPWGARVETPPTRIVALIANPINLRETYGLPSLDVKLEKFLLAKSVASIDSEAVRLDFMRPPVTLERLERALRNRYHILHIVAHSRVNARRGQTELLLEDSTRRVRPVPTSVLSRHLAHQTSRPHLVFLSACHSGPNRRHPSLLTMGQTLVSTGVPAVVAMQGGVHIKTAQALTSAFYARLTEHGVVDRALNQARNVVIHARLPDAEKPVLFMRLPSGRLW
jgi:hypothetical protein